MNSSKNKPNSKINKLNKFYYSAYFCYYSWAPLHFLLLFMGPIVLFQLTFTFIYSTSAKSFQFQQISGSQIEPKGVFVWR